MSITGWMRFVLICKCQFRWSGGLHSSLVRLSQAMLILLEIECCRLGPRVQDLRLDCTLECPETYRKCCCLGPKRPVIGIGCALKVQQNLRTTVGDPGQVSSHFISSSEDPLKMSASWSCFLRGLGVEVTDLYPLMLLLRLDHMPGIRTQNANIGWMPARHARSWLGLGAQLLQELESPLYAMQKQEIHMPTAEEEAVRDAADLPELLPD